MGAGAADEGVRFGTSGWRAVLGEGFTGPRLRRLARAAAAWLAEQGRDEVIVAHDARFLGRHFAVQAAGCVQEAGLRAVLADGPLATPAAVRAVVRRRAAGAIVVTASHNPPEYQGVKVFGPWGGAIGSEDAQRIEALLPRASEREPEPLRGRPVELARAYVRELVRLVDVERIRHSRPRVVCDVMHGAAGGLVAAVLEGCGAGVQLLHPDPDARFGDRAPDPVPAQLAELRRAARRARLGVALDGDGDRFAVVTPSGRGLSETEALALLVDHCARTGRARRGVAISVATGSLVERVAAEHGLSVTRHAIGFKHFREPLESGAAELAGEESGGFCWSRFHRDKDGVLAAVLLLELAATTPIERRLAALVRRHGAGVCGRTALALDAAAREAIARLSRRPPRLADDAPVRRVERVDGLRLGLDDGFLMLRASGTEPLVRIYAEAPSARALRRRLAAGAVLLGAAGARPKSG